MNMAALHSVLNWLSLPTRAEMQWIKMESIDHGGYLTADSRDYEVRECATNLLRANMYCLRL